MIREHYYYKHKKTNRLVLVVALGAGWAGGMQNPTWVKQVIFKHPLDTHNLRDHLTDFERDYVEYNP